MSYSLTVVIPNRNRELKIVSRTLQALVQQKEGTESIARVVVVDYGSALDYQKDLKALVREYRGINLIVCPTQGQLFHKTRAINIVLKKCETTYFMVLDMDCIAHPNFISTAIDLASDGNIYNFPYGFLSEEESKLDRSFNDYKIHHIGELTGTAIFKTQDLLDINGFDEFYHNWGSEDADVFDRLARKDVKTVLYTKEILLKHQWHPKQYRTTANSAPFHSYLERINYQYYEVSNKTNKTIANTAIAWGKPFDLQQYAALDNCDKFLNRYATRDDLTAIIAYLNSKIGNETIAISIIPHPDLSHFKTFIKKIIGKKTPIFLTMQQANDHLLEAIILHHSNTPYNYQFHHAKNKILFTINLSEGV